jgi:hypothetical protein
MREAPAEDGGFSVSLRDQQLITSSLDEIYELPSIRDAVLLLYTAEESIISFTTLKARDTASLLLVRAIGLCNKTEGELDINQLFEEAKQAYRTMGN